MIAAMSWRNRQTRNRDQSMGEQKMDLSIIVPVYNGESHITECLASIFAQTASSLEVIIINDGSSDRSSELIAEFLTGAKERVPETGNAPEVVLIEQENQGVAASRNTGIARARGRFVTFVDQDDQIAPDYCQVYLEHAGDADIVVGGYERITYEGRSLKKVVLQECPWARFVVVAPWAHIYRTEFLRKENITFLTTGIGEDVYFNLRAYAQTEKIVTVQDAGYHWMFNEQSVSNSRQSTIRDDVDPVFLLDHLVSDISNKAFLEDELVEYYMARYVCWYMLFSARGSRRSQISQMYIRLTAWLRKYYPDYLKNRYLGLKCPKGEIRMTGCAVTCYYLAQRMGLLKGLLLLMGRKDEDPV